jgi:hypothetical protein
MKALGLRLGPAFLALLAALVVLLAFLPWAGWLGYARESETISYHETVSRWLFLGGAIVLLSLVLAWLVGPRIDARWDRIAGKVLGIPAWVYVMVVALVSLGAGIVLTELLFTRNPHLVDTMAQLFQARIFRAGSLTAPAPAQYEFFNGQHMVVHDGRWFSQYPPGHPALLALGLLVGLPWLIGPLFTAGTIVLVYLMARRLMGEGPARLAAVLYLISPFALFMGASYMNHVTTGFFLALALYAAVSAEDAGSGYAWAALMGLALACAATIRPLESAAWTVVLGSWLLFRRGWNAAVVAAAVCLLGILPLLAYNAVTTGHPLRFGYTLLWGEGHGLGFHTDPWGFPFTPTEGLSNTALDFQRLNIVLLSWPFPSLIFLIAALLLAARDAGRRKGMVLLAGLLLAAPLAYFFYWHRDDFLGPRFLSASLVPAILLTVAGIVALDSVLGRWRAALRVAVPAGVLCFFGLTLPTQAGLLAGVSVDMKLHPEREVKALGLESPLVFVKVGWGSRLVARLMGWGLSAPSIEETFRLVDGCRIQRALQEADSLGANLSRTEVRRRLEGRLDELRVRGLPIERDLLPDPSVRVDTSRALPADCYREVQRDETGYTFYETLIWRNDPWLRDGVIYARDLGPQKNSELMSRYPDREYLLYTRTSPGFDSKPELMRLPPVVLSSSPRFVEPGDGQR